MESPINLFKPSYRIDECLKEIEICLSKGWTGLGFKTVEFEEKWKEYTGFENAYFINSSTSGLFMSLELFKANYKWQNDSEIITTPITFISTNHAILNACLVPRFADVDNSLNLSPESVRANINKKTKAVMFVGIGGNTDNYIEIKKICTQHGLILILDAAHMAGSKINNRQVGLDADATIFSFQAVKNLPTADGGMICLSHKKHDEEARVRGWLGIDKDTYARTTGMQQYKWKYSVNMVSNKYHGNSIMASLGIVGLKYLDIDNQYRQKLADEYYNSLSECKNINVIRHCNKDQTAISSRHLFQVQILNHDRDKVMQLLNEKKIFPGVHYKNNKSYSPYSQYPSQCDNAEIYSDTLISLPMHVELGIDDARYVANTLRSIIRYD